MGPDGGPALVRIEDHRQFRVPHPLKVLAPPGLDDGDEVGHHRRTRASVVIVMPGRVPPGDPAGMVRCREYNRLKGERADNEQRIWSANPDGETLATTGTPNDDQRFVGGIHILLAGLIDVIARHTLPVMSERRTQPLTQVAVNGIHGGLLGWTREPCVTQADETWRDG